MKNYVKYICKTVDSFIYIYGSLKNASTSMMKEAYRTLHTFSAVISMTYVRKNDVFVRLRF